MAKCDECGLHYSSDHAPDRSYHRRVHDKAINGPKTTLPDGFHIVTHQSPIAVQRLAEQGASAAQRETEYDITSFYGVKKKVDEDNTIAVICVANGRVVGLLVSRERACLRQVELSSFEADHLGSWRPATGQRVESHRRRSIDMIWVLRAKRRQGIAKSLAEALAQHCDMRIEDIAHMVPFREEALRLWIGLKQSTIYVV